MNRIFKRIISIVLILVLVLSISSCTIDYEIPEQNKYSIMENAEITGEYKGRLSAGNSSIEIHFPEKREFTTIVIEEKNNQILNFSIMIKDKDGEYQSVYEQDRIGDFRYCEIGNQKTDSIKICFNSVADDRYSIKNIDVLNIKRNNNRDFRVTSYIVCPTYYENKTVDTEKLQTITDVILFGVARFNENGDVYLQDFEVNGKTVSGEEVFTSVIKDLKTANSNIQIHCNILGPDGTDPDEKEKLHSCAFTENRETLSKNILELLSSYDFDGVFFDYEYPYKNKSQRDYSDFLVYLDSVIDGYILGASLSEWCCNLSKDAVNALDRVEIMAYDDLKTFEGSHAEFASNGGAFAVENFIKKGYDLSKCDLGLPFYGRTHGGDEAWPPYSLICYDIKGPFDNTVNKSYFNGGIYSDGVSTSFNGVQMIKDKTAFAYDYGLGGVMVWHYSCDVPYDNELSLFKAIQVSINS